MPLQSLLGTGSRKYHTNKRAQALKVTISEKIEKIILFGLLLLIFISPLPLGSNRPLPWSVMSLSVGVLLFLWGCIAYFDPKLSRISLRKIWFIVIPFLLVMVWIPIQMFVLDGTLSHPLWQMTEDILKVKTSPSITIDKYKTLESYMKFLCYGVVFLLSLQVSRSSSNAKILVNSVAIASIFYAIYGIYAFKAGDNKILWFDKIEYFGAVTSTFLNKNSYATYVGIGLITSLGLFLNLVISNKGVFTLKDKIIALINNFEFKRVIFLAFVIVLLATLIMTYSRAGLICSAIAILVFICIFALSKPAREFRIIFYIVTFILLLIFGFYVFIKGDQLSNRFSVIDEEIKNRSDIYAITINAIKSNPFVGTGLGTYENNFLIYKDARISLYLHKRVDHAHNTYLETMMEIGIPAFSLLFISIFSSLVICARGVLTRQRNTIYPAISVGVSILIWLHALFDFSVEMPAIAVTYAVILGAGLAQSYSTRKSTSDKESGA